MHEFLILALPFIGACLARGTGGILRDRGAQWTTCALMIVSSLLAWVVLARVAFSESAAFYTIPLFSWIQIGQIQIQWSMRIDTVSCVMMSVVTTISALVHVYSIGYMRNDPAIPRFMALLSLFTFFMLVLVSADDMVQMFFGWEGVGLASYLLIGFWNRRDKANSAAMKAFIVNRIGDVGFALGIFACLQLFGALDFPSIFENAASLSAHQTSFFGVSFQTLDLVCILLFIGAMGKSAQLGLHTWLADAMEGPTPVSALIHAATMVTAGVFMVCRLSPLFEYAETARYVVVFIGALTAFFAASIALTQMDIKKVIAWSTCSQLGYMFCAAGLSAYPVALFHLTTHAFFKALLFLGAGSVIHAMSGEQNLQKMGGMRVMIPFTYITMWIGSLALAGIPIFSGYYSKDAVLEASWGAGGFSGLWAFSLGGIAAFMTAIYSWRLLILVFHGTPRADANVMARAHEAPPSMAVVLGILALGASVSGFLLYPYFIGGSSADFWRQSLLILPEHPAMDALHHVPPLVKWMPVLVSLAGILLAYFLWQGRAAGILGHMVRLARPFYALSLNKWYFDQIYDAVFTRNIWKLGRGFSIGGDKNTIDKYGPDGIAALSVRMASRVRSWQTGYIYHYVLAMLVGLVGLVTLFSLMR